MTGRVRPVPALSSPAMSLPAPDANLARREMTVMFRELLTRAPEVHATAAPRRLQSMFINGIKELPVALY